MKVFHDKKIMRKSVILGQKMLLFNSYLHLFLGKLRSWWYDPFIVHIVFSHGAIEIKDPKNGVVFKVYGQRLKSFLEYQPHGENTETNLSDPLDLNWDFSFFSVIWFLFFLFTILLLIEIIFA